MHFESFSRLSRITFCALFCFLSGGQCELLVSVGVHLMNLCTVDIPSAMSKTNFITFLSHIIFHKYIKQLLATDLLALATMKNAAKCDK